jgi:hypothetical protein
VNDSASKPIAWVQPGAVVVVDRVRESIVVERPWWVRVKRRLAERIIGIALWVDRESW